MLRVCGRFYGDSKGDMGKEGTPAWDNTYQMRMHVPFVVWYIYGGGLTPVGGVGGKAVLFELK